MLLFWLIYIKIISAYYSQCYSECLIVFKSIRNLCYFLAILQLQLIAVSDYFRLQIAQSLQKDTNRLMISQKFQYLMKMTWRSKLSEAVVLINAQTAYCSSISQLVNFIFWHWNSVTSFILFFKGIVVKGSKSRILSENRKIAREILIEKLDEKYNGDDSIAGQKKKIEMKKSSSRDFKRKKLQLLKSASIEEGITKINKLISEKYFNRVWLQCHSNLDRSQLLKKYRNLNLNAHFCTWKQLFQFSFVHWGRYVLRWLFHRIFLCIEGLL